MHITRNKYFICVQRTHSNNTHTTAFDGFGVLKIKFRSFAGVAQVL